MIRQTKAWVAVLVVGSIALIGPATTPTATAVLPNDAFLEASFRVLCRFNDHQMESWATSTGGSEDSPFAYYARTRVSSNIQTAQVDQELIHTPLLQPPAEAYSGLYTPASGYISYEASGRAEATPALPVPAGGDDDVELGPSLVLVISDIRTCGDSGWDSASCSLSARWTGTAWVDHNFDDPEDKCWYD